MKNSITATLVASPAQTKAIRAALGAQSWDARPEKHCQALEAMFLRFGRAMESSCSIATVAPKGQVMRSRHL